MLKLQLTFLIFKRKLPNTKINDINVIKLLNYYNSFSDDKIKYFYHENQLSKIFLQP
jgi:hypothetical protein